MASLYLSYKNEDVELAHSLAKELKQLGHNVTYDALALAPGQNWRDVLLRRNIKLRCRGCPSHGTGAWLSIRYGRDWHGTSVTTEFQQSASTSCIGWRYTDTTGSE